MEFRTIIPGDISKSDLHQFLLGSIAPRPIAFASTLDKEGRANLAPYSYFNAFSSNPPIAVFSSNLRVGDKTRKDTLQNVMDTGEVVINMVSFDIVRQMAITSVEFPAGVDEFAKAGLTPVASEEVKPFRVLESPVQMECRVSEIIPLGEGGGAGHLIICKILRMHIRESVINERNRIDPHKIDLVGRLGRSYYVRASGDAVFPVVQSVLKPAIGFDALPAHLRESKLLTGNELSQIAGLQEKPSHASIDVLKTSKLGIELLEKRAGSLEKAVRTLHKKIKDSLDSGNIEEAASLTWIFGD